MSSRAVHLTVMAGGYVVEPTEDTFTACAPNGNWSPNNDGDVIYLVTEDPRKVTCKRCIKITEYFNA